MMGLSLNLNVSVGSGIMIPPNNPGTPTPLAIADFKNTTYTVGGDPVSLSDMFVENTDWNSFNPADIINGVGYQPSSPHGPVLADEFAADFLANGVSFLAIFAGGSFQLEQADFPDFTQQAWVKGGEGTGDVSVGDLYESVPTAGLGTQYIAGRISADRLAISTNGNTVVGITPADALIGDHIGFILYANGHALEYIEFHSGNLTDAQLQAISLNTFPRCTSAPVIFGDLAQGSVLTCPTGTWTNNPDSFEYQWYSGNADPHMIAGETASTYTTKPIDVDGQVWATVLATNTTGSGLVEADPYGPVVAA